MAPAGGPALVSPGDLRARVRRFLDDAVDVLDVHEVALVPPADLFERAAAEPYRRARDPVDVTRAVRIRIELPVLRVDAG